jgi:hypothetical protein
MENDFRGLEDLIKNVVQGSDCPFSSQLENLIKIVVQESDCPFSQYDARRPCDRRHTRRLW